MKEMPQNIESERYVLAALLSALGGSKYHDVADILETGMFYNDANRTIYEAIERIETAARPLDLLTVRDELTQMARLDSIGGLGYLMDITAGFVTDANLRHHAGLIMQAARRRELIAYAQRLETLAADNTVDVPTLIGETEAGVLEITGKTQAINDVAIRDGIPEAIAEIEARILERREKGIAGISTGIAEFDATFGGLKGGKLTYWGGRPGMGKSLLGLKILQGAAEAGTPAGYISLEMGWRELLFRSFADAANVENHRIENGSVDQVELARINGEAATRLSALPIYFTDRGGMTINQFSSIARRWKARYNIGLIVIDYVQLLRGKGRDKYEEYGRISPALKELAKSLDIHIFALIQLSRAVESDQFKIPDVHHLRDTGQFEQDADMIGFNWIPEKYGLRHLPAALLGKDQGEDVAGKICLMVKKNRGGRIGQVWQNISLNYQRLTPEAPAMGFPPQPF